MIKVEYIEINGVRIDIVDIVDIITEIDEDTINLEPLYLGTSFKITGAIKSSTKLIKFCFDCIKSFVMKIHDYSIN